MVGDSYAGVFQLVQVLVRFDRSFQFPPGQRRIASGRAGLNGERHLELLQLVGRQTSPFILKLMNLAAADQVQIQIKTAAKFLHNRSGDSSGTSGDDPSAAIGWLASAGYYWSRNCSDH